MRKTVKLAPLPRTVCPGKHEATKRVRFIYKTVMTLDARAAAQGRRHVNSCQMMLFVL